MVNDKARISHLFRPVNLAIIALTMYLFRWALVKPILFRLNAIMEMNFESGMNEWQFVLLVLSAVLIAAGGYILNDIRDVETDRINGKANPVDKCISKDKARLLYNLTTYPGVLIGFVLGYMLGNYNLGLFQFMAAASLWFYSNYFKTSYLIGNLIVAFVVSLVPLTVGVYEVYLLQTGYAEVFARYENLNFNFLAFWFVGYAAFAFLFTLVREIIKDMEDAEGDRETGAATLPLASGMRAAKTVVILLYAVILGGLYFVGENYLADLFSLVYIGFISILIISSAAMVWVAQTPAGFRRAGLLNKVISLIGILYLVPFAYMLYKGEFLMHL